jgi:hypothetical protein
MGNHNGTGGNQRQPVFNVPFPLIYVPRNNTKIHVKFCRNKALHLQTFLHFGGGHINQWGRYKTFKSCEDKSLLFFAAASRRSFAVGIMQQLLDAGLRARPPRLETYGCSPMYDAVMSGGCQSASCCPLCKQQLPWHHQVLRQSLTRF